MYIKNKISCVILLTMLICYSHNTLFAREDLNDNSFDNNGSTEQTLDNTQTIVMKKSTHPYFKGLEAFENKDYKNALKYFESAISTDDKNIDVYNYLGITYRNLGDYDKSIETFKKSLQIEPDNPNTYQLLGVANLFKGDYIESLKAFQAFKKLTPNNPEVYFSLGNLYSIQKNYIKSNYNYLKALKLYKDEQNLLKSDVYLNIGTNYFRQNNFDEAINSFNISIENNIENEKAYYFLGLSYLYKSPSEKDKAKENIMKSLNSGYKVSEDILKQIEDN
ncbi:MAG: tetratricopeptide repeat protein [Cyanobacteriota bacterium]